MSITPDVADSAFKHIVIKNFQRGSDQAQHIIDVAERKFGKALLSVRQTDKGIDLQFRSNALDRKDFRDFVGWVRFFLL